MPRRMRRLRAPRRKRGGKRVWKKRTTTNVNRALQPIPQRYICKLKYADDINADGAGRFNFNLNSLFDPNRTGVGHQPYAFDTLASLYNRYRVISCGWRITAPTTATVVQVGALPANEVLPIVSMFELKENPRAKYFVQQPGGQTIVLSGKSYLPSLMGRTKAQYMADDRYQALTTADPAELGVLNLFAASAGGLGQPNATLNVLLEYTVEFFDVKNVGTS